MGNEYEGMVLVMLEDRKNDRFEKLFFINELHARVAAIRWEESGDGRNAILMEGVVY